MPDDITAQELQERLSLVERMIAEGRRHTESWGWTFVLWGVVYYAAMAWSVWSHSAWAWPITILIGVIATVLIASVKSGHHPETSLGRAIGSIWIALAFSMCVLFPALSLSGRLADLHLFMAVISAILGMANGASALILRWKVQFACAIVWWIAAAGTCFGSDLQSTIVFLTAIFVCQIVFGMYGMIAGGQKRGQRVSGNA
jgi:hypothetical protein